MGAGSAQTSAAAGDGAQHLCTLLYLEALLAEPDELAVVLRHGWGVHHQGVLLIAATRGNHLHAILIVDGGSLGDEALGELTGGAVITRHLLAQGEEITHQGTHADASGTDEIDRLYCINIHNT